MPDGHAGGRHSDLEYLGDLLNDFGVRSELTAEEAQRIIASRYRAFDYVEVAESMRSRIGQEGLPTILLNSCTRIHAFLFDDILCNAGEYRKPEDPYGGRVYFGGRRGHRRRMRYSGSDPAEIEGDLRSAFEHLAECENPHRSSIAFYMAFNRVHPFYDANGRVGRLLVNIYLYLCGYYVNWDAIDKRKSKFLKKMNACHDRRNSRTALYERYFGYLLNFWKRYIDPLDTFYRPEVD